MSSLEKLSISDLGALLNYLRNKRHIIDESNKERGLEFLHNTEITELEKTITVILEKEIEILSKNL